MQCEEWADANSELFKEAHDETVHKNSYKRKLYELISASLGVETIAAGIQVSTVVPQQCHIFCQGNLIDRHHRLGYNYSVMVCEKWHCQYVRRCYSWQK